MRIAYVHGYEGVTGPLLLGAFLDAGAALTSVEQVWHHLHLPAAELSCARVPCTDAMATHVTWTASHAHAFLHPHSKAAPTVRYLCQMRIGAQVGGWFVFFKPATN